MHLEPSPHAHWFPFSRFATASKGRQRHIGDSVIQETVQNLLCKILNQSSWSFPRGPYGIPLRSAHNVV